MGKVLLIAALCVWTTGCVATTYSKTIEKTLDAEGQLVSTVITEQVIQPNRSAPAMELEYIQGY